MPTTKHGMEGTATYSCWAAMLYRCRTSTSAKFKDYGARGITVCDSWLSFENFLADMGEKPKGKSLDRKDNDGCYEPSNCRWATPLEQVQNRRPNRTRTDSPHGLAGVRWRADRNMFEARIYANQKLTILGTRGDLFEAICLRKSAENKLAKTPATL